MSTYSPIASQTLSTSAPSVTFSSIPQGYTDLVIIIKGQGTSNIAITTTFNNDTATNYSRAYFYADGNGQASGRIQNESGIVFSFNAARGHTIMHINGYSNSVGFKNALISNDYYDNATVRTSGVWRNTAPITSIKFSGSDIASGTVISLYGLAGGQVGAKAAGGVITTSGGYVYHTFTSSGRFIPSENLTADVLVVAGGGGGGGYFSSGYRASGGGGAGGLLSFTSQNLIANTGYGVTVGAGGAGGYRNTSQAASGTNSQFGTLTTVIGGGFGVNQYVAGEIPGGNGGSGGGGAFTAGGTAISGQGNNGGSSTNDGAGGGGGKGAAGGSTTNTNGGNGGIGGTSSLINDIGAAVGYAILSSGNYYLAGGGGGGKYADGTQGSGGIGGGGAAGNNSNGTSGTANTGGGGGAASYSSGQGTVNATGGSGGSGLVIVRYAV